jgi:hypothetical protein
MLKQVLIVLLIAAVLWEAKALYSSWVSFSQSQLEEIHHLPITERPNRRGHFIGNLIRFLAHHWRSR